MTEKKKGRTGRPPKENPKKNIWSIRFSDAENELLESLCKVFRNDNETKAETLERVVVYALGVYWKRFEECERKRWSLLKSRINEYADKVGRPPVRSYEEVKKLAPVSLSPVPASPSVPSPSVPSPSVPLPSPTTNATGEQVAPSLVPASLSGWFDDSGGKNE